MPHGGGGILGEGGREGQGPLLADHLSGGGLGGLSLLLLLLLHLLLRRVLGVVLHMEIGNIECG